MEALAYTWFNRFVAIRFMELHGYLEHGYRMLSHPDPTKTIPEILELAEHVDLPGLSKEKVIDLKLDVNKESELYQLLLLAQCHALHSAMPFLFEGIDDETELVLPENLLHSDSIIRKLVAASDPEDWQEVEVLGWLYQFYISERKDEVMARKSAVPTEDIPAVTQLFTPHWIVRYLVENSLGRLWLLNRPGSNLRAHMPYHIEGEADTDFLKITKPEDIRLLDPACGSGHMLTYAFDLLFLIYEEEGYVPNEIPALILRHNLHGLEICPAPPSLPIWPSFSRHVEILAASSSPAISSRPASLPCKMSDSMKANCGTTSSHSISANSSISLCFSFFINSKTPRRSARSFGPVSMKRASPMSAKPSRQKTLAANSFSAKLTLKSCACSNKLKCLHDVITSLWLIRRTWAAKG